MTWQQAQKILEEQYNIFRKPTCLGVLQESIPRGQNPATVKRAVIEQEHRVRDTVDQACRTFSKKRTWPKLNAEELLIVSQRLQMGLSFLRLLAPEYKADQIAGDPISKVPDWRVLEFLLVDYWERAGHEQYLFAQTRLL